MNRIFSSPKFSGNCSQSIKNLRVVDVLGLCSDNIAPDPKETTVKMN